jgi:hypothetical protein
MWRDARHGWIAKVEKVQIHDTSYTEILLEVMAACDASLIGRRLRCSHGFLRDRCHPYDPEGPRS